MSAFQLGQISRAPTDIDRIKVYEALDHDGSNYPLTALAVECRGELLQARAFLPTANIAADETVRDFGTWATVERDLYMALVEERLSRHGSLTEDENNALWPQIKARVHARFRRRPGTTGEKAPPRPFRGR
jgi:hypothetical protein